MAGKTKRGIDFAGWDVHIFEDDSRIDELIDAQGWTGFAIYFYLCQKAYATDGYFYRWSYSNSATTARRMGGGVGSDNVKQVVALCLRIGLFDNRLFEGEGVLTNKDIQERFMLAIEKRSASGRKIDPDLWLLNADETKPYIIIPENNNSLPENDLFLPENDTKESKVKKSKVNESKGDIPEGQASGNSSEIKQQKFGEYGHIKLNHEQYQKLCSDYGESIIVDYIKKIDEWIQMKGKNPYKDFNLAIRNWLNRDGIKQKSADDFDVDKYKNLINMF